MKKIMIACIITAMCLQPSHTHANFINDMSKKDIFATLAFMNIIGLVASGGYGAYNVKKFWDLRKELAQENLCPDIKKELEAEANAYKKAVLKYGSIAILEFFLTAGCVYGMKSIEEEEPAYKIEIDNDNDEDDDDLL